MTATQPAQTEQKTSRLRTFAFAIVSTMLILAFVGFKAGVHDLVLVATLIILEVTFSFDNAIVNSRLLRHMSHFWQMVFLTVGIFVAVFLVRFALPIVIVQLTTHDLSFWGVVQLALNDPTTYAHELHKAGPVIDAFGGTFLVMIGIAYFLDEEKDVHWIGWLERRLAPMGRFDNLTVFVMLAAAIAMFFTASDDPAVKTSIIVAAVCGIALHMGLDLFGSIADGNADEDEDDSTDSKSKATKVLTGAAAFVMFIRLEVLDASFSFDGVIGAFAITSSVLLIMAGLGAGAVWVRALTVHLLRTGTLAKYKYLEHGAMWAILFLGGVMLAKLYHLELPEVATGSIGLVFIGLSVISSKISGWREARLTR